MSNSEPSSLWNEFRWPNFFTKEEVAYINKYVERNFTGIEPSSEGAKDVYGNLTKQVSSKKYINYEKIESLLSRLVKEAYCVANLDFGYTTFGPLGAQPLLHNTYESSSKDKYDWHIDESASPMYDTKLTLIINLSTEPYEGGEFQTWKYYEETHKDFSRPGSVFMFKSHILHRVTPVTSGTRKSLTMFIHGPRFS